MCEITSETIEQAKAFVLDLLKRELPGECVFHSEKHTLDVFNNSQIIGNAINLSKKELNCLAIGALFHDTGYVKDYANHEQVSAIMARQYLERKNVDEDFISRIERAILATKVPQKPQDLISKALCDADLMHLAHDDYFERIKPMRLEWKLIGRVDLSEKEFHQQSLEFFSKHKYHTKYGREVLEPKKKLNLNKIREKI